MPTFAAVSRLSKTVFLAPRSCVARAYSSKAPHPGYAFAFDIDGVLIKGSRTIPEARKALRLLNGDNAAKRQVPFILLTNGGGVTEAAKAEQISQMLDVEILPDQVVLSHTPMQSLVPKYKDKRVLVVGGKDRSCYEVAKGYGFNDVVIPDDIHQWDPTVWPFRASERNSAVDIKGDMQFNAVLMFHDSRDWGRDLQIVMDVLYADQGRVGTQKQDCSVQDTPLYFSNNDIIWSTDFPVPRIGQGAFKKALESLYSTLTGHNLQSTSFGKPHAAMYAYAERVLSNLRGFESSSKRPRVYAVGDNPAADIRGANDYGWNSILVRTGVFRESGNSKEFPANKVCDHVEEAVEWVIRKEEEGNVGA
ncbi:HAD hydrolase [Syncephalastrum racemosum]|uniref:HAD hydrolase n=1 Tax=Syncephalastrum racemosum TaxID=13706 RepID=A0A1X2H454_SYNRA|nr:HAD hydrolase [Syncephalastrum racemosum]